MEPIPQAVDVTRPAGTASGLARMEARRLGHQYLGPEHLLAGLLAEGDNLAARVPVANGLDLDTVRAGIDRLIAQRVRHRAAQPVPHPPQVRTDPSPLVCARAIGFAAHAAIDRDQEVETRRERALPALPVDGPQPLRLLVEAEGRTLEGLREALLEAIDGR